MEKNGESANQRSSLEKRTLLEDSLPLRVSMEVYGPVLSEKSTRPGQDKGKPPGVLLLADLTEPQLVKTRQNQDLNLLQLKGQDKEAPGRFTKISERITKDEDGRVSEIKYPNERVRKFAYDKNSQLIKVVQPDGSTYEKQDNGLWKQTGGNPNSIDLPKQASVSKDGTYSYENYLNEKLEIKADGSSKKLLNGTNISFDAAGKVTEVEYHNGRKRAFAYKDDKLWTISEGEVRHWVISDQVYTPDVTPTGIRSPEINKYGIYTARHPNGDLERIEQDGTQTFEQPNESKISKDRQGRIIRIQYAGDASEAKYKSFEYDTSGRLSKYTNAAGNEYLRAEDGSFKRADTGERISNLKLSSDGSISYLDKNGQIHTSFPNGTSVATERTSKELDEIASSLKRPIADPVFAKSRAIIEALSHPDRVELDNRYRELFGMSIKDAAQQIQTPDKQDNLKASLVSISESQLRLAVMQKLKIQEVKDAMKSINSFKERAEQQGLTPDLIMSTQEQIKADLDLGNAEAAFRNPRLRLERKLLEAAPTLGSLEEKFGVSSQAKVQRDGSVLRQYFVYDEKLRKLPVLESVENRPETIERQLKVFQETKAADLETKYKIKISRNGQSDDFPREAELRTPKIHELLALESALKNSNPSTRKINGMDIDVHFIKKQDSDGFASVETRPNGQLIVRFQPRQRTVKEIRGTALHEWGHIAEENVDAETFQTFASKMGYRTVKFKNETGEEKTQWQLRAKDGYYYTLNDPSNRFGDWKRIDENGRALKADGEPVSSTNSTEAFLISNDEMRKNAEVTPISDYFPNPSESLAELIKHFRSDSESRKQIFFNNNNAYQAVKQFDQAEIDKILGVNADGSSRFIRLPNAEIVENNDSNRLVLRRFEVFNTRQHKKMLRIQDRKI